MREFASNLKPVLALAAAVRAATANGPAVDRLGYEAVSVLIQTGEYTNGTHTVAIEDSTDGNTWNAVPATQLTKPLPVVDAAGKANTATLIGYIGDNRFLRVRLNVTGSPATGAVVGATVLLGRGRARPAA